MSRVPPQDLEAQDALVGAVLLDVSAFDTARRIVKPSDFVGHDYQRLWETVGLLRDAGEAVDAVTVAPGLNGSRQEPLKWLHQLQNEVPSISAATSYANRVLACSKARALIWFGAELIEAGYANRDSSSIAARLGTQLLDDERLRRHERGDLRGFYPDIATLDSGDERDDLQPWIAEGWLRRGQRLMVVARAGLGKSTLLRQLAFCAAAGVHPLTGQPQKRAARSLIVEAEASQFDITASMKSILLGVRRARDLRSAFDTERPALLHRAGGLNLRDPSGVAALEAAIQLHQPELVVLGPVKYLHTMQPGENYETATLALHGVLNRIIDQYGVALALEAHFSRGDHGAPGGSERWVDWPDVGIAVHPPDDDITRTLQAGSECEVRQFRIPRDSQVFVPRALIRGAAKRLPWSVEDGPDPHRIGKSIFATRYGGVPSHEAIVYEQQEF